MSYREVGKKALSSVMTIKKNIEIIEKNVFEKSQNDEDTYKSIIYEVLDYVTKGLKLQEILEEVKQNRM